MNGEKNTGRAIAGFFITFLMTFMLVFSGILLPLKLSIFKSADINEFLENIDFHSTVQEIVLNEVNDQVSDNATDDSMTGKLTSNAIEAVFTEDIVKDMTTSVTNAITKDEEIDLTGIKDKCIDVVTDISMQAVEDVFEEIKGTTSIVDLETLKNNSIIQQYQQDYDVDVTATIMEKMENIYESSSVNLDEVDIEEIKTEAKSAVVEYVIPTIEESIDEYIDEANVIVNEQIEQIKEEGEITEITNAFEILISVVNVALIVTLLIIFIFGLLQVFVVYKNGKNRAFRNMGIASIISGLFIICISAVINLAVNIFNDEFTGSRIDGIMKDFVVNNISRISDKLMTTGIVFIVLFVVFIVVSIIWKKKMTVNELVEEKNEIFK